MLPEKTKKIFDKTYQSLLERIDERGYAPTSLEGGAYPGMFIRDASIQTVAHITMGDMKPAKSILNYILTYHAANGVNKAFHIINKLSDEENQVSYENISFPVSLNTPLTFSFFVKTKNDQTITKIFLPITTKTPQNGILTLVLKKKISELKTHALSSISVNLNKIKNGGIDVLIDLPLYKIEPGNNYIMELMCSNKTAVLTNQPKIYLSSFSPLSVWDQADGHYMLVWAWAKFFESAVSESDTEWLKITYPVIAAFANYHFEHNRLSKELNLIVNKNLEHSRHNYYLKNTYDLITNVFASQALHLLKKAAVKFKDNYHAELWNYYSQLILSGIDTNLTEYYKIPGENIAKKIYSELIYADSGIKLTGFSWVNLAPIAADWFALDNEIMQNTYRAYYATSSFEYDKEFKDMLLTHKVLDEKTDDSDATHLVANSSHRAVIGKGFAWEIEWCRKTGDMQRLNKLLRFVETYNANGYFPESMWGGKKYSDAANQEHASWQIIEIAHLIGDNRIK